MQNVYCAGASTMTWAALMNWSTLPSSAWGGLCTATCGSLIRWVTASHHRTALHACHSSILPFWKLRQPAEDRFIHPWWAVSDARQPCSSFHLIIFGTVLVRILPYTSCSSLQGVARPPLGGLSISTQPPPPKKKKLWLALHLCTNLWSLSPPTHVKMAAGFGSSPSCLRYSASSSVCSSSA